MKLRYCSQQPFLMGETMEFQDYFPVWDRLTERERALLLSRVALRRVKKGTVLHNGSADCSGLFLVRSGRLRAYILSEQGREITVYRLFERDVCLFSASCMLRSIQFDIIIEAEADTEIWVLPSEVYQSVMENSAPIANFTNELMAARFSEVMWLIEQILWKSLDKRLAAFLLEESAVEQSDTLRITHETVANHLGSHREVITRMLKYFQQEGAVRLSRATVEIVDRDRLMRQAEE